jgi:hypothetical protein
VNSDQDQTTLSGPLAGDFGLAATLSDGTMIGITVKETT